MNTGELSKQSRENESSLIKDPCISLLCLEKKTVIELMILFLSLKYIYLKLILILFSPETL
jgi:hypothetical protein